MSETPCIELRHSWQKCQWLFFHSFHDTSRFRKPTGRLGHGNCHRFSVAAAVSFAAAAAAAAARNSCPYMGGANKAYVLAEAAAATALQLSYVSAPKQTQIYTVGGLA